MSEAAKRFIILCYMSICAKGAVCIKYSLKQYHSKRREKKLKSNMKMSLIIEKFKFPNIKCCHQPQHNLCDKNPSYKVGDFISFQYKMYVGSCLFK